MPAIRNIALSAARMRSGLVAVGVLVTAAIITLCLRRYGLSTLAVEHEAIRGWLAGDGLYAYRSPENEAGAAQPPALTLLLTPLTLLPLVAAGWLLALAGLAALLLVTLIMAGPVARRHGRRRGPFVLAAAALALLAEPVRAAVGLGRPELLIFALLAADLVGLRRAARVRHRSLAALLRSRRSPRGRAPIAVRLTRAFRRADYIGDLSQSSKRSEVDQTGGGTLRRIWAGGSWAGIGTGLATAFSATALLFVVYLLVTRQRRAALTAVATATMVTLGVLVVAPAETFAWYGTTMWELARPAPVSDLDNQSLAGVMARLYGFPAPPVLVWFSFGILLVAVGLIRARSAHTEGDEVAAFTLVGLTIAVAGPVTTAAESLWLLPAVLILADAGLRRRLSSRLPRATRRAGTAYLTMAAAGYLILITTPVWSLRWNLPALTLILLVNTLPWRQGSPALPTIRPAPHRPAAIPLPRGGTVRGS
ncbi:glycosyltransferase family 87 protein [Actinoplanes subglobosus]|uniref:Glycosyltransferase family 87 protein n=1 Tax=Actinoplanes subglobosus TaxID=1547892 RepID=A0ABV8IV98_9ACTN